MAISRKYADRLQLHSGYRYSLITPSSRRIGFLPKNCPNSSRGNQKYPRKKEKILRKYQMKLRKNEMKVRKNFSFPRWIIQNIYGRISRFPPPSDFCHRDVAALDTGMCAVTTMFCQIVFFLTFGARSHVRCCRMVSSSSAKTTDKAPDT